MNTQRPTEVLRSRYLTELDEAIGSLPHRLAVELRAGVAEELSELTSEQLLQRITELGSPAEVARAALAADREAAAAPNQSGKAEGFTVGGSPHLPPAGPAATGAGPSTPRPLSEGRGYAVVALVALGIGGIVLPAIGWIIGCVLVSTSSLWRTREKLVAILTPPVAAIVALALGWALNGIFGGGTESATGSPLLPAAYDVVWSAVLFTGFVAAPLSALWLLLRLRGRTAPEHVSGVIESR